MAERMPWCAARLRVLHFRKRAPALSALPDLETLRCAYALPERFVYLPNQFWVHKDHETVVRALALLKLRGVACTVVCTGLEHDHRNPGHMTYLRALIRSLDLDPWIRMLGLIPREHCWALMRHAMAVLNPSRFEGWSSTVEEARAMGVRTLLSDIDVHREQSPLGCVFFRTGDSADLAQRLAALDGTSVSRLVDADADFRAFGLAYETIVRQALGGTGVTNKRHGANRCYTV